MGCNQTRPKFYNEYEKIDEKDPHFLSGPFINSQLSSFEDFELKCQNKTYIEEMMKTIHSRPTQESIGYRKELENGEFEKKITYFTLGQVGEMAENLAKNIKLLNLSVEDTFDDGKFQFMGIFSKNCPEWFITDLACQLNSITSVTYYSTLGDIAFEHISKQTRVSTICLSTSSIGVFLKYYKSLNLEFVKNLIVYDITQNVSEKQMEDLTSSSLMLKVHLFSNLIKKPQENVELTVSKADTILTLCYTSGTTALPKGAKLSQRNFYATLGAIEDAGFYMDNNDLHLSYLPLAHVFERLVLLTCAYKGVRVCFAAGDLRTKLLENIETSKPTFLVAVPRVLDTFRKVLYDKLSKLTGCKKSLTERAIRIKRENFRKSGAITHSIYDKIIFNKIRQAFGGRVKLFVTGSAPMTRDLAEDIKILFSVPIVEGYGMTECTAALCVSHISDLSNNSVGGCAKGQRMKLLPVPEMNYSSQTKLGDKASPTGEICMKGPCIFHGYFMNPEETKKALDADGWLHSGDVGRIMPEDRGLKIIDRVKEIFKLSQGEYIAPSKLESLYSKSKYVTQIFVYGDSTHSYLIAVIVPNKANLKTVADASNVEDEQKLFNDKNVVDAIKKDFETIVKENGLNGLERINSFHLTSKEFTVDNGCLTPTMKLVRRKVEDFFKPEIQALYAKN